MGWLTLCLASEHNRCMDAPTNRDEGSPDYHPEYVKDVLAHDYKVPGIGRRYYPVVGLIIFGLMVLFIWHFWWYSSDDVFFGGLVVLLAIGALAAAVRRFAVRLKH